MKRKLNGSSPHEQSYLLNYATSGADIGHLKRNNAQIGTIGNTNTTDGRAKS